MRDQVAEPGCKYLTCVDLYLNPDSVAASLPVTSLGTLLGLARFTFHCELELKVSSRNGLIGYLAFPQAF